MAKLNVLRNGSVRSTANGATFRRLTGIAARLRKGYSVEIAPYPSSSGKWLVRVVAPTRGSTQGMTTVDSYYEVIARNQAEAERFIKTDGLWGGALAERVSKTIGDIGEAHFVSRLRGAGIFDSIWGKQVRFTDVHQFQNASGHGVDAIARVAHAPPPAAPECRRLRCVRDQIDAGGPRSPSQHRHKSKNADAVRLCKGPLATGTQCRQLS
ncbi:hypothetical protein [Celeribacter sp.]|uniref:hypothetical protein n=1 Tax=Celeribacter sp. TaxID=1890673 RepID=UPI003A951760